MVHFITSVSTGITVVTIVSEEAGSDIRPGKMLIKYKDCYNLLLRLAKYY